MLTKKKIPFINENKSIQSGLKIINLKKLGILIARNKFLKTTGVFTDGDIKRTIQKNVNIKKNKILAICFNFDKYYKIFYYNLKIIKSFWMFW